jgi:putative ATP-binding cassette transporter
MNLVRFLLRASGRMATLVVVTGLVSGASSAGLIALVNLMLNDGAAAPVAWACAFVALGAVRLGTHGLSQLILTRLTQDTVARLRVDLGRKILAAPLRRLEEIGTPRLFAVLTDDVLAIVDALPGVPTLAVHLAVLVGCSAYLAWVSWPVLIGTMCFVILGLFSSRLIVRQAYAAFGVARHQQDSLMGLFRALIEGAKELKLHRGRRAAFVEQELRPAVAALRDQSVLAGKWYVLFDCWTQFLFYTLLGLVVFALPALKDVGVPTLVSYVLTLLYMMRPIIAVMNVLPLLGRASVAVSRVDELSRTLAADGREAPPAPKPPRWKRLELDGVTYSYPEEENSRFTVGPVDLSFRPGELVFLVGSNGSGKSTLAKILTGLYAPEGGVIRIDGRPVTDEWREEYRQLFSAVFSDFYLFENLSEPGGADLDGRAEEYLRRLRLGHKVRVRNGAFSTTALSQGQRKRLALLTTYLEDRSFYVFDEWAANQDPQFKEVFYKQLLPELKARGKTTLVISHDDRYLHVADRWVRMEDGQLYRPTDAVDSVQTAASPG